MYRTSTNLDESVVDLASYRQKRDFQREQTERQSLATLEAEEAISEIARHLLMAVRVITGRSC